MWLGLITCEMTGRRLRSKDSTKDTIINLHESFRVPCKTGTIPADTCKEVDKLTNESKLIYDSCL